MGRYVSRAATEILSFEVITYTGNGGSANPVTFAYKPRRLWFAVGAQEAGCRAIIGNDTEISGEAIGSVAAVGPFASTLFSSNVVDMNALSFLISSGSSALNTFSRIYVMFCLETT